MIEIISGGLQTTVQDGGRSGYQSSGVPVCGAMDAPALWRANILCGNDWEEAALEICALGPTIKFLESNIFAITGGEFAAMLDGIPLEIGRTYLANKGATLAIGGAKTGFRAYLAFAGGLDIPPVMDSRSTCLAASFGGYEGRKLQKGDRIAFRTPQLWLRGLPQRVLPQNYDHTAPVRVVAGAQRDALTEDSLETFFYSVYKVSDKSDRMGLRLSGPALRFAGGRDANIISDGVAMGAIQVPDGQPIVMMADRQTVGGYVKLGAVCTADLPLLAQKKPGDTVRFAPVTVQEAQKLYHMQRRALRSSQAALDWEEIW